MNESAPIPIIVGALVTLLVVGIGAGILNSFGQNLSNQNDYQEIAELGNEIEEACETFESSETEDIFFDTVTTVDLRDNSLKLDEDPSGDTALRLELSSPDSDSEEESDTQVGNVRSVSCSEPTLELTNDGGVDLLTGEIDRGKYEFIVEANYTSDEVEISARED
jgi:hypothetical protein